MNKSINMLALKIFCSIVIGLTLTGLYNVTFAQSIYFDDSDSQVMKLGNASHYEIGLRKSNGSVAYIIDKSTGENITEGSRFEQLWRVLFSDSNWTYVGSKDYGLSGEDTFSYVWNNSSKTLNLTYTPGPSSPSKMAALVEIKPDESYFFDLIITISHEFGVPLEYVLFPSSLVFQENNIEEALLPIIPGVILESSFFNENRSYTTSYPGWPGVFADFVSIKLQNGNFSAYSIYDTDQPIPKVEIGFVHDDEYIPNSTHSWHVYPTYLLDGQEWASPTFRILVGQSYKTAIEQFRTDNHFDQYLSVKQKLGNNFERVIRSPFLSVDFETKFTEFDNTLVLLPSPAIINPSSYYPGGFDHNYPDFLPPDPQYGTTEELKALFERAQARGIMVMPYINPTWWDDDSPTVQNELPPLTINDIAVIEKNGQPKIEEYGDSDGIVVSPQHPFVISRLDRLMNEMTIDVPSDFIYEDQIGARAGFLDFNPSANSPLSYLQGWFEHTKKHTNIGLGTETGFDRLLETESFFFGSTLLHKEIGSTSSYWGDDNWNNYPFISLMASDKTLFYQGNNFGETMTTNLYILSWNLSFGFMLNYLVENDIDTFYPIWLDIVAQFQKYVVSRYAGELMTDYTEIQNNISQSIFPSVTVTTNWNETSSYSINSHILPPNGSLVTSNDGSLTAGIFNTYNGDTLTSGDHYLIVERFFSDDSIRIWQPLGGDTPINLDRQSLDGGTDLHCYGFTDSTIFEVAVHVDSQNIKFNWNRYYNSKKVNRYVITLQPVYLTTPEISEPANRATITPQNLVLRWQAVEGATGYQVQIAVDDTFKQVLLDVSDISQNEYTPGTLEAGTTYFWRVRATNQSHTSFWSFVYRFRVAGVNIADRLVAFYPFNGSAEDSAGASDGTLSGDVTLTQDRFDNENQAYAFDGNDDSIILPESEAFTSIDREITVSAWIYPKSFASETGVMMRDRFWRMFLLEDGSLFGNIFNENGDENRVGSAAKASLNTWSHAAFTYDGQSIRVYLNGKQSGSLTYPAIRIGRQDYSSNPVLGTGFGNSQNDFNGSIDDVRVYDRALTTEEMDELYRFIPTAVDQLEDESIPTEYKLHQNYPNPFNPSTTISYQLPQPGNVNISVFNVAGQLVETLLDEHKKAGYHSVIWRASGVGSGLYFYRIKSGDYISVKKCIVMK